MECFKMLDASNRAEYETWLQIWSEWSAREVFAHPEYVKLFARKCDRSVCAVQKKSDGLIIMPMILRPISAEIWADEENQSYDMVAPYGYGGPYVSGQYYLQVFWRHFLRWASDRGIIAAFFRFSPFAADVSGLIDSVDVTGGNVIRSLTEGKDGIWNDYKHAVRTCVRSAEMNEVTVEFDETEERLPSFIRLYYQTMQRCHADRQYFFPVEFFHRIVANLRGQYFFAYAMYKGKEIAGKLVLYSQEHLYPFLGGADERYFNLNPNQLLDTRIFYWGVENGKKSCVLGGGYDGFDGVFQYKKKFAPTGVVPFSVGKHILDPTEYRKMYVKRQEFEMKQGRDWHNEGIFFPEYRSKSD